MSETKKDEEIYTYIHIYIEGWCERKKDSGGWKREGNRKEVETRMFQRFPERGSLRVETDWG